MRDRFELIEGSILDRELVRKAVQGVDYVFHLAAMISVPESMQKPVECNEINTTGTLVVSPSRCKPATRERMQTSQTTFISSKVKVEFLFSNQPLTSTWEG